MVLRGLGHDDDLGGVGQPGNFVGAGDHMPGVIGVAEHTLDLGVPGVADDDAHVAALDVTCGQMLHPTHVRARGVQQHRLRIPQRGVALHGHAVGPDDDRAGGLLVVEHLNTATGQHL